MGKKKNDKLPCRNYTSAFGIPNNMRDACNTEKTLSLEPKKP